MLSKVLSAVVQGIHAVPVTIETDLGRGMPSFNVVGLADVTVKEARERIRAAVINSTLDYPKGRITINMSPAGIRKKGSHFDLPMAIGILAASKQIKVSELEHIGFIGELSLDGTIRGGSGILPMVIALKNQGAKGVVVPFERQEEAALVSGINVYPAQSLLSLIEQLHDGMEISQFTGQAEPHEHHERFNVDFSDVKGQAYAKRAITIAVAGGHGILMTGSPSTGKTMISERIPTIMPEMSETEILETTVIYSVAGLLGKERPCITKRPFRQPHQRITRAGMFGGGAIPYPGEVTLASQGVLFLDEVGEFDRNLIDGLRVPLENKQVSLVRFGKTYVFPAEFMLVAATNPCKCGYYGDATQKCVCKRGEIERYKAKISGPILDRIDLHLNLQPLSFDELNGEITDSSADMRAQIRRARDIQKERYLNEDIDLNHQMDDALADQHCELNEEGIALASRAYETLKLNPRTLLKVKRIARTIADLDGSEAVTTEHFAEALAYREIHR
ncbi:magnesium chelatase family protein [Clostridiales Family XIII bacterium PM5-7]